MPLAALAEPIRDTISFGQVNVFLMALVLTNVLLPKPKYLRWTTGILAGMAAAIKLTPLVFVCASSFVSSGAKPSPPVRLSRAGGYLAYVIHPAASKMYWLSTLSDTSRIGGVKYSSNQSFQGFFARVLPEAFSKTGAQCRSSSRHRVHRARYSAGEPIRVDGEQAAADKHQRNCAAAADLPTRSAIFSVFMVPSLGMACAAPYGDHGFDIEPAGQKRLVERRCGCRS